MMDTRPEMFLAKGENTMFQLDEVATENVHEL
jgi:hypothetical protein